jgi:hypothetical protein
LVQENEMNVAIRFLAAAAFCLTSTAAIAADPLGQPALKWSPELSEEFDNTTGLPIKPFSSLWTSNWAGCQACVTVPIQPSNELAAYDPAQAKVMPNGTLRLLAINKPWTDTATGKTYPYRSGIIHSYGKYAIANLHDGAAIYVEVRAKFTTVNGKFANWPGIWTSGYTGKWPNWGEIDVVEANRAGNPSWHLFASGVTASGSATIANPGSYHVYGTRWKPKTSTTAGYVSFYYDGKRIRTIAANIAGPMYLALNYPVGDKASGGNGYINVVPAAMYADYVRTWYCSGPTC